MQGNREQDGGKVPFRLLDWRRFDCKLHGDLCLRYERPVDRLSHRIFETRREALPVIIGLSGIADVREEAQAPIWGQMALGFS